LPWTPPSRSPSAVSPVGSGERSRGWSILDDDEIRPRGWSVLHDDADTSPEANADLIAALGLHGSSPLSAPSSPTSSAASEHQHPPPYTPAESTSFGIAGSGGGGSGGDGGRPTNGGEEEGAGKSEDSDSRSGVPLWEDPAEDDDALPLRNSCSGATTRSRAAKQGFRNEMPLSTSTPGGR
jgi:hypothetical protein